MFQVHIQNPSVARWQSRLARVPRWAWILFFLLVVIPMIVAGVILLISLASIGFVVMLGLVLLVAFVGFVRRLFSRRPRGHASNQIIVRSVRVIDP